MTTIHPTVRAQAEGGIGSAAASAKGAINQDKLKQRYRSLLDTTSVWWGRPSASPGKSEKRKRTTNVSKQLALEGMRAQLDEMVPLIRQVMKQTTPGMVWM
jgi:transposase, IS5 family